jgi:hypothetical protein
VENLGLQNNWTPGVFQKSSQVEFKGGSLLDFTGLACAVDASSIVVTQLRQLKFEKSI